MVGDRVVKRGLLAVAVIAAAGFVAVHPGAVKAFYSDLYPTDAAKAEALELCFSENHAFNRLDSSERNACYQHMLHSVGELSSASMMSSLANPVDLQRAAGQSRLPRNDVRRQEQTERVLQTIR